MKVELLINKSIEENASLYFDKAKKAKKKIEGVKKILINYKIKLEQEKEIKTKKIEKRKVKAIKREWYEKFHWFFTSDGLLAIGGRDATTNDILIKKHMTSQDLVFHTDMAGSPFFILKNVENVERNFKSIKETASATACYSRAWKKGFYSADVFYVFPHQISKTAQSGEYLPKGAFMIRGKTNYVEPEMKIAIGIKEEKIIGGPVDAIKKNAEKYIVIVPGESKTGEIAKKIFKKLGGNLDDIIKFIPAGGSKLELKESKI